MDPEQLKFEVSSRYSPPRSTSPGGCSSWTSQPLWVPRDNNEKNGGDENQGDGEEEGRRGGLVLMERRRRGSRGFISSGEVV